MESNKVERLGTFIERCDHLNAEGKYTSKDVRGISNEKEFMMTKSDLGGRSLASFQIVRPQEFAFNRRTTRMGEKIAVGFNESDRDIIVTEDYVVFRVRDTERLLPAFLFLYLNRAEFDRYARWDSWGSATEFFNWENMCNVPIRLPSLAAQRKAVAIYRGLKENLAAQEAGLADLKLTCDGYLDVLRHRLPPTKIGPYLRLSDIRNEHQLGLASVRGISTEKKLIETKANMSGISLANYKELQPRQFVYVADTSRRGDKVAIALNDSDETYLVSSIYTTFCTDETKLLPEYLMLILNYSTDKGSMLSNPCHN